MSLSVVLTWQASIGATYYDVYRDGVKVASAITVTTWTDTAVNPGETHQYDVDAGNVSGTSAATAPITVNIPPVLAVPANLSAVAASSTRVTVAWDAVTGAGAYNVYRNGTLVFTTQELTVSDSGVVAQTAYQYAVQAVSSLDAVLNSAISGTVSVTTPPTPPAVPAAPTGLTATIQ
jgi:hypothetical protein